MKPDLDTVIQAARWLLRALLVLSVLGGVIACLQMPVQYSLLPVPLAAHKEPQL